MGNPLISPGIAKSAEGIFLKLEIDTPTDFKLYKPVEILEAQQGDNLQYFREVNMNGVTKHIKYVIHLEEVGSGEIKQWQVGSANAINQLKEIQAEVGDIVTIEKIKLGERKQDVRYKIKLKQKASEAEQEEVPPAADEEIPL